jgi:hypothetical protein
MGRLEGDLARRRGRQNVVIRRQLKGRHVEHYRNFLPERIEAVALNRVEDVDERSSREQRNPFRPI